LSDGTEVVYVNRKRVVDGREHDEVIKSKKERKRYLQLIQLQESGSIKKLTHEPEFLIAKTLRINGKTYRRRRFRPDFSFDVVRDTILGNSTLLQKGTHVILEEKSAGTVKDPAYSLRKHLFLEKYIDGKENIVFIEMVH